jgi:hypothetical protein
MITSLRWLRGFIGFLVLGKAASSINFITILLQGNSQGYLVASFLMDLIILSILFGFYYAMYVGINKLHLKHTDDINKPILKNIWSL